jgi:hypothetical protein
VTGAAAPERHHGLLAALIGLGDVGFDRFLEEHRRRVADRVALLLAALGIACILLAIFRGRLGELMTGDLVGLGGILVTAATIVLGLAAGARPPD